MKDTSRNDWQTMGADENPLFRRAVAPWYDSWIACLITILLMAAVLLFAAAGLSVAWETPAFHGYAWVPAALMLTCAGIIASIAVRLVRRYARLRKKAKEQNSLAADRR